MPAAGKNPLEIKSYGSGPGAVTIIPLVFNSATFMKFGFILITSSARS